MSLYVPYYRPYNKHNTNILAPGAIFFCLSGGFPLWSIFVLFKSFRPSCHFTFHIIVLTTNTTQTSMPRWDRTHDPSKRAATDPRLRPHGHWDRRIRTHDHSKRADADNAWDRAATGIGNPLILTERKYARVPFQRFTCYSKRQKSPKV
jgi:hypothetical protein